MFQKMKISKQNKILLLSFLVFAIFSMFYSFSKKAEPEKSADKIYADTFIPKGFVLIPLELANYESVSALIDQFGVIDLYAGSPQMAGSVKIATRVKILRAPLNPNLFAILVAEENSSQIMKSAGPFWAVVQNRQTVSEKTQSKENRKIQIEYYKGG